MKKLFGLLIQLIGIILMFVASAPMSIWFILIFLILGVALIVKGGFMVNDYNDMIRKENEESKLNYNPKTKKNELYRNKH